MKNFKRVIGNKGAFGVDGMGVDELKPYLQINWKPIKEQLQEGSRLKDICPDLELPERPWRSPNQPLPEPGGGA